MFLFFWSKHVKTKELQTVATRRTRDWSNLLYDVVLPCATIVFVGMGKKRSGVTLSDLFNPSLYSAIFVPHTMLAICQGLILGTVEPQFPIVERDVFKWLGLSNWSPFAPGGPGDHVLRRTA